MLEDLRPVLRGWVSYYRKSQVRIPFEELDQWTRRKRRAILWRQWKRPWTRARKLIRRGWDHARAWTSATKGRGPWWNAGASHMNQAVPTRYLHQLGLVSLAMGGRNLDEAERLIDRAIALAGPLPTLLDTRSTVRLASGQREKALEDIRTVIAEEPRANRYYHLARILQSCGKTKEASEAMQKAAALRLTAEQLHPLERPQFEKMKSLVP